MENKAISSYKNKVITTSDLLETLQRIGITQGDTLCIHTDISSFGTPVIPEKNLYLNAILETLKCAVGSDGCIIMPTFTYSFCNNQEFNIQDTPSKMGILTEHFRKQPGTERTHDPIFSFAVFGRDRKQFLETNDNCFGSQSVFAKLHQQNAKLILLGSQVKGYTFFHYIEQCFDVPYRYFKTFTGTLVDGDKRYDASCVYYVRCLDRQSEPNISKIIELLRSTDNFNDINFAYGSIVSIDLTRFYDAVMKKLDQDVTSLLA